MCHPFKKRVEMPLNEQHTLILLTIIIYGAAILFWLDWKAYINSAELNSRFKPSLPAA